MERQAEQTSGESGRGIGRERLYRLLMGGVTFGLVVRFGRVVRTAPVASWTTGRDWEEVRDYFQRRGATIEEVDEGGRVVARKGDDETR